MDDVKAALGAVAGDQAFADDFLARFVQGREVVNYEPLLARAGLALRAASPGRAFAGELRLVDVQGRVRVGGDVPLNSPAYQAGLDRDDVILAVAGTDIASTSDFERVIRARKPGDAVPVVFERRGQRVAATLRLAQDPRLEIIAFEDLGRPMTDGHRRFRDAWLSSQARNTF
jgi:predicted metalloprotease with PDZ domain